MRLDHRVVFITGASRGIGKAIALGCAREGADVVITARPETPGALTPRHPLADIAHEIESLGRKALTLHFDVCDDEECEAAVRRARDELGRIDALVHNAGVRWSADILETPAEKFDAIMGVHARAAFVLSRAVLPQMIAQRYGHIVMMSPPVQPVELAQHAAYAIAKLGMTMIAQAIAEEVAEHNVTAHALWPAVPIESHATAYVHAGLPDVSRTADILADATVALLAREPSARRGRAWLDEDVLRADGLTDFSPYRSTGEVEPYMPPMSAPMSVSPATK